MRTASLLFMTLWSLAILPTVQAKPNFVLILTDDQGWSQLSETMDPAVPVAKSSYLETPNMNRLIAQGMRFSSGYAPAPLCTPTRRSILCGTSVARSGPEFKSQWVPADHTTIPKALQAVDARYRCAHYGKWGEQMISTPEQCGYDHSDGMTGNATGGMPNTLGVKGGHEDGPPHFIDNEDPKRTSSITTKAIDFIRQQTEADHPFYVQVSYYAQHLSVVTSEKMLAKYETKGEPDRGYPQAWAAMLEELDMGVGRLLDALKKLEIEEETYVFFLSDNGGRGTVPGGNTNRPETNLPLTGAKHSLYEGGIRVPFIALGPGIVPGSVCRTPVVGYDLLPTFFALAGGDVAELPDEIDGTNLQLLLLNCETQTFKRKNEAIIFHRPNRLFSAIREGDHKLMLFWKRNGQVDRHELYDFSSSPVEAGNDLASSESGKADAFQAKLLAYLKDVNADKPIPLQGKKAVQQKKAAPGKKKGK